MLHHDRIRLQASRPDSLALLRWLLVPIDAYSGSMDIGVDCWWLSTDCQTIIRRRPLAFC